MDIRNYCKPATTYFTISMMALLIMAFQNISADSNMYCLGSYSCHVYSTSLVFLVKLLFILFWTWLLNIFCNEGNSNLAWFFVILPFFIMFISIALFMYNNISNNAWYYNNYLSYVDPRSYITTNGGGSSIVNMIPRGLRRITGYY